jgi:pimeloyl-ACP methyl ester carboxylesterase
MISNTEVEAAPLKKVTNGDYVVLLHGLGRSSLSMKRLDWSLAKQGYRIVNHTYPSRRWPIERVADDYLRELLTGGLTDQSVKVHFVTHSLGGILLRQYLSSYTLTNLGRVVMLAPPNEGSELADRLQSNFVYRWMLGPSFQQLGTDARSLPKRLGPVAFELGVIAGDRSLNPFFSRRLPHPNDSKVSVIGTQVVGMKDFLVIHSSHTWIMTRRETLRQTACFLANGCFEHYRNN